MEETKKVARGARAVTIAVLISRLLGLVREQVLAGLFGAGFQMDAYVVAYRIPNLLRDLLAEGALASAFVKVFSEWHEKKGPQETWALASRALSTIALLVLALVLLGEVLAPYLVRLLAPGFSTFPGKIELATFLTRIMFPFLFLVSLSAVFGGMLNALGTFFLPAISSALFNLVSVGTGISLYFLLPRWGFAPITGMALGVVLGGTFQAFLQWPKLRRLGFRFRFAPSLTDPGVKAIFRLMGPSVLGLSAVQLNVFVNTYFATLCGPGAVSWLAYAFRLMYVPLGLFGVALQVAILPVASRQAARGDLSALKGTYLSSLLMGMSLALPSALGLIVLAKPIVQLIFEHGRFSPLDTQYTATALALFSLALPAYGLTKVTVPVFYALGRPQIPMYGSFLAVGINVFLLWQLVDILNFRAVALSTSIALTIQALFLLFLLNKTLEGLPWKRFLQGLPGLLLSSLALTLLALALRHFLNALHGWGFALVLLGGIGACAALYFVLIAFLGPEEGLYLWEAFKRRRAG